MHDIISLIYAAKLKHVARSAITYAGERGELTMVKSAAGRNIGVLRNAQFRAWKPHGGKHRRKK